MTDTKEETKDPGPTPEEERDVAREAQNLPEGAVPEQRPQASQINESAGDSELTKQLKDRGAIPDDNEPMGQAAYDKASSRSQLKEAAANSVEEGVHAGSRVRVTAGPHEGRILAVLRVVRDGSVADIVRRSAGSPEQLYNSPKELETRAIGDERDGETVYLNADNGDEWEKLNEDWGGSRAGRRH